MEDRYNNDNNNKQENLIYAICLVFSGLINIAFWSSYNEIMSDLQKGDLLFFWLAAFAGSASFIGILVHYFIYKYGNN